MTEPTTPRTALPDPANDEMLTMSGYEWWRYRRAIEAEARAAALDEADRAIEKAQTGEQEIARLTGRTIDSVLRVSGMGMARAAIDALREGA